MKALYTNQGFLHFNVIFILNNLPMATNMVNDRHNKNLDFWLPRPWCSHYVSLQLWLPPVTGRMSCLSLSVRLVIIDHNSYFKLIQQATSFVPVKISRPPYLSQFFYWFNVTTFFASILLICKIGKIVHTILQLLLTGYEDKMISMLMSCFKVLRNFLAISPFICSKRIIVFKKPEVFWGLNNTKYVKHLR